MVVSPPDGVLRGTVRRTDSRQPIDPPPNGWKWLTLLTLGIGLLPLWFSLVVAAFALWMSIAMLRWFLGLRGSGGGIGLLDLLLLRPLARGSGDRRQLPVYIHELDTGGAVTQLKQVGDLEVGAVMQGHVIEVRVDSVRGEPVLRGGHNVTTGTRFEMPGNPWKAAFVVALGVVAALWTVVAPRLQAGAGP